LWLESDRMGFLLTTLTQQSLSNQIDVVKNERRQSVENRAYGLMSEKITQTLYPAPHPYHGDIIGSMDDIGAASITDVQEFFRTYYTPANATLTLAGDFEIAETKALIAKYFGTLKGKPAPPRPKVSTPSLTGETRIEFPEPIGQLQKLKMVWIGPSAYQPDTATLDVLAHVVSGTRSSRLDRKVSFEDRIAQSVTAYFSEYAAGGRFVIDITAAPGRTAAEAEAAVKGVLADLRKNPPTAAEVERAINTTETALIGGLQRMGARADFLQQFNHYLGDPGRLGWNIRRYRNVTPAAVGAAIERYLGDDRLVVHAIPVGAQP
ncbi:MAG: pitrilysin family protein, partial [Myxococcota bacterium]